MLAVGLRGREAAPQPRWLEGAQERRDTESDPAIDPVSSELLRTFSGKKGRK